MKRFIALLTLALVFSACAPSTPQARIAKYPDLFARLSQKEQRLVQEGQLAPGMTRDAVILAWGAPAQRFEGSKNAKLTERWDYVSTVPVYSSGFYGGFGYGYGRYGPYGNRGYYGSGFAMGPEIAYLPYRAASVWFVDHVVDSWERVR